MANASKVQVQKKQEPEESKAELYGETNPAHEQSRQSSQETREAAKDTVDSFSEVALKFLD